MNLPNFRSIIFTIYDGDKLLNVLYLWRTDKSYKDTRVALDPVWWCDWKL